jgi:hypothetical protein
MGCQNHVARGGNGQKLGNALHDSKDECGDEIHALLFRFLV